MQKTLSLAVIGLGLALLTYMIVVEDEPGAVPLAMIVVGSVWRLVDWMRVRLRAPTAYMPPRGGRRLTLVSRRQVVTS